MSDMSFMLFQFDMHIAFGSVHIFFHINHLQNVSKF